MLNCTLMVIKTDFIFLSSRLPLAFIKLFNAGEKFVVHKHEGYLQSKIVYWIMNVHITPRTIYLTRHGESQYNVSGR